MVVVGKGVSSLNLQLLPLFVSDFFCQLQNRKKKESGACAKLILINLLQTQIRGILGEFESLY